MGEDIENVRGRVVAYEHAGLLGRAAQQLGRRAPSAEDRERVRRHRLGPEGRIAEDITGAVRASQPVWDLLAAKDLPEDVSVRELDDIRDCLVGRPVPFGEAVEPVSIRFGDDPSSVHVVAEAIPSAVEPHEVTGYRYAVLTSSGAQEEPFILALTERAPGDHEVVASMLAAATFLRYERELGVIDQGRLQRLADVVESDVRTIARTHQALLDA